MKALRHVLLVLALGWVMLGHALAFTLLVENGDAAPPSAPAMPTLPAIPEPPPPPDPDAEGDEPVEATAPEDADERNYQSVQDAVITFGEDSVVEANSMADVAIAILGNATVHGQVSDAAISVVGNTTVTGESGDAALAIFGNVKVEGHVRGDVVAVLGGVELAPGATVDGQVVSIGGAVVRGKDSIVRGQIVNVAASKTMPDWTGLHTWLREGLLWGRLLVLDARAQWAWWVAATFFGLYLLIGLIAPKALTRCADTLAQSPGRTLLAAFLSVIVLPLLMLVLSVTVIGLPLVGLFIIVLSLAGKAALLVFFGRRFGLQNPLVALVVGAVILTGLYMIPVVGLLAYVFATTLGVGMVSYTVIREWPRQSRPPTRSTPPPAPSPIPPAAAAAEVTAKPNDPTSPPQAAAAFTATPEATVIPSIPPVSAPEPEPLQRDAETAARAGFMIRLGASLIDFIVVAFVSSLLGGMILLVFAVYCIVLWALRGSTLGGIICGLKVVRLDGRPMDWTTSVIRALGGFLSLVPAGLGFIWVAFDPDAQSWHDRIAGTTIIESRSKRGLV